MTRTLLLLAAALSGCGVELVDPCQRVAGTCLAVQIDPSATVSQVDGVVLHLSGGGLDATKMVGDGSALGLPIAVAIVFEQLPASPLDLVITAEGRLNGSKAGTGTASASIGAGQHQTVHVSLIGATGGGDLAMSGDGNPSDGGSDDLATGCATAGEIRCNPTDHSLEQVCSPALTWQDQPCMSGAAPVYACTEAKHQCVDTGWAQWSYAAAKPSPRFSTVADPNGNGEDIVADAWTGLSWQLNPANATYTFGTQAQADCDGLTYGGFADWRLPSPIELATLIDYAVGAPTVQSPFVASTRSEAYWTSTRFQGGGSSAFSVSFANGSVSAAAVTSAYRVRCVR